MIMKRKQKRLLVTTKLSISIWLILAYFIVSCDNYGLKESVVHLDERGILLDSKGELSSSDIFESGSHLIQRTDSMVLFKVSERKSQIVGSIQTIEGEIVEIEYLIKYKPLLDSLISLYNTFGLDYQKYTVKQESLSVMRSIFKDCKKEELLNCYNSKAPIIEDSLSLAFRRVYLEATHLGDLVVK